MTAEQPQPVKRYAHRKSRFDLTNYQVRTALAKFFAEEGRSLGTLCGLPHEVGGTRRKASKPTADAQAGK